MTTEQSSFPIPASLQDLEREPYNLSPYPHDFDDDDEAARADSFDRLVDGIEQGNKNLLSQGMIVFQITTAYEGYDENWNGNERIQALYTLVRKSTSLAPATRWRLIRALCQAVKLMSSLLADENDDCEEDMLQEDEHSFPTGESSQPSQQSSSTSNKTSRIVSQQFRDAFACHLYMLFSAMFIMESEAKIGAGMKQSRSRSDQEGDEAVQMRAACADAMLRAAQSMSQNRNKLWKRGVADESVVVLPCRIAYQMLESATGVLARKAASGDAALGMIAATVDSSEVSLMGTILAALMDMLHSYEHMATLCAELCCMVSEKPTNRLAVDLIREIGRLDTHGHVAENSRASGIKFVAPFIHELAARRPRIVLANVSHLLPHLDSEPYCLRSAIVTALGAIVENIGRSLQPDQQTESENSQESAPEDSATSRENLEKSRSALLDILEARSHDVSSYTRSAVLKTWISLTQSGTLPVERVIPCTVLAIDRLQDKTVMARKQALQLLTTMLENNPFMGDLDPEPYRRKLSEMYNYVKSNLPEDLKEAHEAALKEAKENDQPEETLLELENATLAAAIAEADSMDGTDQLNPKDQEYKAKVEALKFAQAALEFIDQYEDASANLHGMLLSANASDVTEALRFFVKARHFKLPCAITGMKQALSLMWSTEQNIRDEVLKAFVDVFIAKPGTDGEECLPHDQIAYNLLMLSDQSTTSELASIEEAIGSLVKSGRIPAEVFSILWSAAAKGGSGISPAVAIHILAMAASADRSIVDSKSRLKTLLDVALGDATEERRDWKMASAASVALQCVARAEVDQTCAKYLVLERIIEQLCAVTRGDWCIDNNERDTLEWFSAAEQALGALFVVSPQPEVSCADIIRGMHMQTFSATECHPLRLARFFHVLGHIALKLLVYTEALSGTVRRATAKKTLQKQIEADKAKNSKESKTAAAEEDQIEAELGMAAEAEAENERKVADIAEKEIVGRGLLSIYGPLLARVVAQEGETSGSDVLMQTSTLALCKFMCVSSSFCEKHLPVIFTALSNAPQSHVVLRANTVIALGDLAFRFPNEVEPYTPRIYACLRDSSTIVRRHTLMVLTHLILNDMVKVKGQICEIVVCLRDKDHRIRDTSRLLFHELSKRSNNPVYNLLPDIVSQLSQISMAKDDFRNIMSFLLGYIKKERQNEMLIEKLCQRIPKCTSVGQKADIAYCMAQLKANDRSIKHLIDNFKLYKDDLYDEDFKRQFSSIISKTKKFAKPELKQALEEWETKLNEQAESSAENNRAGEKAARSKAKASKRGARRKPKQIDTIAEGSDDETEYSETEKENAPSQKQRSTRRSRRNEFTEVAVA